MPKKKRTTLRDKAAGLLGAKLLQLEKEGWKLRRWAKGQEPIDRPILGRLPGSKVQQLQEAGIDFRKGRPPKSLALEELPEP
ncbi:MAG: hypothetical protein MJE77_08550 [Proteobacteria bacterium]|nr:hypothetical protein [Pseudomonadota bacterium]